MTGHHALIDRVMDHVSVSHEATTTGAIAETIAMTAHQNATLTDFAPRSHSGRELNKIKIVITTPRSPRRRSPQFNFTSAAAPEEVIAAAQSVGHFPLDVLRDISPPRGGGAAT